MSDIILATECGGSDPTSGLAANPVIGSLSGRQVLEGSTVIISETQTKAETLGFVETAVMRACNYV